MMRPQYSPITDQVSRLYETSKESN